MKRIRIAVNDETGALFCLDEERAPDDKPPKIFTPAGAIQLRWAKLVDLDGEFLVIDVEPTADLFLRPN